MRIQHSVCKSVNGNERKIYNQRYSVSQRSRKGKGKTNWPIQCSVAHFAISVQNADVQKVHATGLESEKIK